MQVIIAQGHTPSLQDNSISVVIDVIRAFTTAHQAFLRGVSEVWLCGSIEETRAVKSWFDKGKVVMAGERNARPIKGFDFGNSPMQVSRQNLNEKIMALTTTNGVTAARHAVQYGEVLVTGFTNAKATAQYLLKCLEKTPDLPVNLVASHPDGDEDVACADYINSILTGKPLAAESIVERIRGAEPAQKFLKGNDEDFNSCDIEMCCRQYSPEFIMRVENNDSPILRAITL